MKTDKKLERNKVQARTIMDVSLGMSRNYHMGFPIAYAWQINKVFNHGMGSLAFVRAVPEDKVLLINKNLMNKREKARFERMLTLFKGWSLVEVSLGYPEWYFIRDLKDVYNRKN